ncbi:HNH endonuclease signature motif containing protein [Rhodoplanes elegans]|uniref:HNH endonuclease n=1 Tax=Rhodoplanes elegans TaxID=29408 RepID=UPI003083F73C
MVRPGEPCSCRPARAPDLRPSARQRGYDHEWEQLRASVLAEQPRCAKCGAPAEHVDHIQPVRFRPDLRLVRSNLRPLCERCHNARSARQQAEWRRREGGV